MEAKARTRLSKFLSFVLRHEPSAVGIALDENGWVAVDALLAACRAHAHPLTRDVLVEIVETSPKRRFALSEDGTRIRASQGHSVAIDLAYEPREPPEYLFHGTVAPSLQAIRAEGLNRMGRHHVHLSPDVETAHAVGMRRGKPIVLRIAAGDMHRAGFAFFLSENGVWLTDHVPARFIEDDRAP